MFVLKILLKIMIWWISHCIYVQICMRNEFFKVELLGEKISALKFGYKLSNCFLKKFIPIYHPSKYEVSDTVTVPIWRWKYLFLWSLNLHLFVMSAEYIFTCFKEIPLWNKNKQFLFLFCEVCLYDLCLVSIGLLFSYWFFFIYY